MRLSRRCRRTIHVNVAFGLGWTVILIVLAACGLLGAEGAIIAAVIVAVAIVAVAIVAVAIGAVVAIIAAMAATGQVVLRENSLGRAFRLA